ncbi:hypothetical protein HDU97_009405 [Phlyctochytrium planicorne]|nr:hypothetical protein HDU97_009405 [Phlyctochytrium planicorne]
MTQIARYSWNRESNHLHRRYPSRVAMGEQQQQENHIQLYSQMHRMPSQCHQRLTESGLSSQIHPIDPRLMMEASPWRPHADPGSSSTLQGALSRFGLSPWRPHTTKAPGAKRHRKASPPKRGFPRYVPFHQHHGRAQPTNHDEKEASERLELARLTFPNPTQTIFDNTIINSYSHHNPGDFAQSPFRYPFGSDALPPCGSTEPLLPTSLPPASSNDAKSQRLPPAIINLIPSVTQPSDGVLMQLEFDRRFGGEEAGADIVDELLPLRQSRNDVMKSGGAGLPDCSRLELLANLGEQIPPLGCAAPTVMPVEKVDLHASMGCAYDSRSDSSKRPRDMFDVSRTGDILDGANALPSKTAESVEQPFTWSYIEDRVKQQVRQVPPTSLSSLDDEIDLLEVLPDFGTDGVRPIDSSAEQFIRFDASAQGSPILAGIKNPTVREQNATCITSKKDAATVMRPPLLPSSGSSGQLSDSQMSQKLVSVFASSSHPTLQPRCITRFPSIPLADFYTSQSLPRILAAGFECPGVAMAGCNFLQLGTDSRRDLQRKAPNPVSLQLGTPAVVEKRKTRRKTSPAQEEQLLNDNSPTSRNAPVDKELSSSKKPRIPLTIQEKRIRNCEASKKSRIKKNETIEELEKRVKAYVDRQNGMDIRAGCLEAENSILRVREKELVTRIGGLEEMVRGMREAAATVFMK